MKFDIILPTLCRNSLNSTIQSVLGQSHQNWNLIVMSDGVKYSPEMNLPQDPRILLFDLPLNNKDSGATPRNEAIKLGSAPLIAYIDDDDKWLPNHLSHHLSFYANNESLTCVRTSGYHLRIKRRSRLSKKVVEIYGPENHIDIMTVGISHKRDFVEDKNIWWQKSDNHDKTLWNDIIGHGGIGQFDKNITFGYTR